MIRRLKIRWIVGGAALLVLLSAACVQLAPPTLSRLGEARPNDAPSDSAAIGGVALPNPTVPASPVPAPGRQTVAVRRGPIAELLAVGGRVAGPEEESLSLSVTGRAETVAVKPGQLVEAGQILLEAESKEIAKQLGAARAGLETSSIRLEQAQAQAQARQRATGARAQAGQREAEAALRRAQADLERVKAGPSVSDRRTAEAAVISARGGLERAEADLARATDGPSPSELRVAEQQVTSAQLALRRAEAEQARVTGGPDPAAARTAERDFAAAQTALDRARAEMDRLTRGPDPDTVRAAERDVERAQNELRAAQGTRADRDSQAARAAAIANAQLGLSGAQDRLARARQGPPAYEVDIARRNVQSAQADLDTARRGLETSRKGPDQLSVDTVNAAAESARATLENAQARFDELQTGPPASRVAAAATAVEGARAALAGAAARLAELNGHPTAAELRDPLDRLAAAQEALEAARSESEAPPDGGDPDGFDQLLLQKGVEQDRAQVEALERDLAATRLLAPFSGIVAAVQVRPSDPIEAGRALLTLARPGDPIVRAELAERDTPRLAVGQTAAVQIDGPDAAPLSASVTALSPAQDGAGRVAELRAAWPTPPTLGASAQVTVTLQQKADALLAPQRAIRSSGPRRYVEYLDGTGRRMADVEVGIVAGGDAEILSGLSEGQLVLVGP